MTSPTEDDAIQINLKIRIPFRGQPIEINESGKVSDIANAGYTRTEDQAGKSERGKMPIRISSVRLPAPGLPHQVNSIGSGQTGFVASGNLDGRSPTPDEVRLSCGGDVVTVIPDLSTGEWYHAAVPGAQCSYAEPFPPNTLRVEYYKNGNCLSAETVPFFGLCNSSLRGSLSPSARPTAFLPISYQVKVDGFSKSLKSFNGTWSLRVVPCGPCSDSIHWRVELPNNEGCIEFIGNTFNESAELLFVKGAAEIRYTKPAGSWIPMNIAELADCKCRSLAPGASIPAIVHVEPA